MRVFGLKDVSLTAKQAVALGYFDGGHLGHAALLKKTVEEAKRLGCESAVFSFHTLPTKSGAPLSTQEDRLAFFADKGIENVILAHFEELRSLTPEAFVSLLEERCCARLALCGFNFRFGAGASGDSALLCRLLPESIVLPPFLYGGAPVSASRIREALLSGAVEDAAAMLGRPYTVSGTVSHGKEMGRTLGFPTANIAPETLLPRHGVYKTAVELDGTLYTGLTDVGVRPTVEGDGCARVETFLQGFSGDLYGKTLKISFLSFLREEKKFASVSKLQAQIAEDLKRCK